jgi:hypothetical protein
MTNWVNSGPHPALSSTGPKQVMKGQKLTKTFLDEECRIVREVAQKTAQVKEEPRPV